MALAAEVAVKAIDKVREAGLVDGHLQEAVTVAGHDWHIHAIYWRGSDQVRVQGHLTEPPVASMETIFGLFGGDDGSTKFDFTCPASWVPEPAMRAVASEPRET